MSPTPVSMSDPTAPASYSWEATSEQVAARYGVPIEEVVRFDLNTSPTPPELAARILSAGRFETSLSEYPPSDYRRLSEAAAARYGVAVDEILVGAGADEILDIAAKTFLPPGGTAVIPTPSYAMYRVLTEQRAARVRPVPRLGAAAGWAIDLGLTRTIARGADLVWLCSPNNPTALAEPDGAIARLLADLLVDAERDGRAAPVVVLDEAYAEFVGTSLHPLRAIYPGLVVVRTLSKAYALAGLRVGFALAARPTIAAHGAVPAAGLRRDHVGDRGHRSAAGSDDRAVRGRARPGRARAPDARPSDRSAGGRDPASRTSCSSRSTARSDRRRWPTGSSGAGSSPARSRRRIRSPTTSG